MLPSFFTQVVTIVHPASRIVRGSTVPDWDSATQTVVSGCEVQTPTTSMDMDGRHETLIAGTVYMPPGTTVCAGDAIVHDGTRYLVDGEPIVWRSPTGRVSHVQARITDWRG